jgi:hypothetical protein
MASRICFSRLLIVTSSILVFDAACNIFSVVWRRSALLVEEVNDDNH